MKRDDFFVRARKLKAEIEQILIDTACWNDNVRKPGEEPIDPDPDGTLVTLRAYCDGVLSGDVYIAPEPGGRRDA